ncbi:MAG: hypothetical protein GTN53_22935 [Candidatus Aminicenantes bacterium]|nr:hypothetical protein [Candidatus Aminicenantes bacterium]NIQ69359.1 hypothetical protein [Candidatus Aminicenantes bacterium]NIT25360.1 hypothetical protein [Candidatus Aminicenantes bacterium]
MTSEKWTPILPVPADAPAPFDKHFKLGNPAHSWAYKNRKGESLGFNYHFNLEDGSIQIYSAVYCSNEKGARAWQWAPFPEPRPLYGLELLAANPGDQVLIVQDEKIADSARALFKNLVVVITWPSDIKDIKAVDWKPLKGRRVVIWPNNDQPGINAADEIGMIIKNFVNGVKVVKPPLQAPKGFHLGTGIAKGWQLEPTIKYLKENLRDPVQPIKLPPGPPAESQEGAQAPAPPENSKAFDADLYPFRVLGYDRSFCYYLPEGSQQIVKLGYEQHDEKHITGYLAPIDFWQDTWTVQKKRKNQTTGQWETYRSGVDWKAVKRFLIWTLSNKAGVYAGGENVRGPGIWRDNKRFIIHLGDRLVVDGKVTSMAKFNSNYIYEKWRTREREKFDPLPVSASVELLNILERFAWARDINARLMAGFIVAGIMGGALPWRPHVWLNGPQGCGKSSIIKEVVRPCLGDCISIFIEGSTTEAGLRQAVNNCSFPILFDEAESMDQRGKVRMDNVIELMRSSASPDGGNILKGTPRGAVQRFNVQSCFCLASISNNSRLAADVARIVNLEMTEPNTEIKWEIMQREIQERLNPEYCGRLRARIFHILPAIKHNIEVYTKAARDELDSQRFGDVYGVLLGAAHCLATESLAQLDNSREFLKWGDWTDERAQRYVKDEINCLIQILQRIVTVKAGQLKDRNLWELMKAAYSGPEEIPKDKFDMPDYSVLTKKDAIETARRYGVLYKYEDGRPWIIIANNNWYIQQWLKDTQYSPNWAKWLKRIREKIDDKIYSAQTITPRVFLPGQPPARGVMVPYEIAARYLDTENE